MHYTDTPAEPTTFASCEGNVPHAVCGEQLNSRTAWRLQELIVVYKSLLWLQACIAKPGLLALTEELLR